MRFCRHTRRLCRHTHAGGCGLTLYVSAGHNQYLTDRIDGLITDATNSPFTRNILPYVYIENPDQKLKWNVYSFDEGIASRVPYEAAARVLPQSKRSFAGYAVRQGLAIAMEHNFMASAAGKENFKNQLQQLVGSIQLTNDLDVHMALLLAPSYQKTMDEKYHDNHKTLSQSCRSYIDTFGILQKIPNAMDILVEDAKTTFSTWGSKPPTFCLCNNILTAQLTMGTDRTDYVTNGPDGLKRLAQGPDLASYRGLQIINTRKFSMDAGVAPRDLLRRRVRVSEYYHIPWHTDNINRKWEFYDQGRDSMFSKSWDELVTASLVTDFADDSLDQRLRDAQVFYNHAMHPGNTKPADEEYLQEAIGRFRNLFPNMAQENEPDNPPIPGVNAYNTVGPDLLLLRPCIEHYMLGVMFGRGGTQELGATFWGQTELSCYDDAQHGIWGMSYKYHERAVVTNERNLGRVFDVSFDGYTGGMGQTFLKWDLAGTDDFKTHMDDRTSPYNGVDIMVCSVVAGDDKSQWPSPLVFHPEVRDVSVCPESSKMVSNIADNNIMDLKNKFLQNGIDGKARLQYLFEKLKIHTWGDADAGNMSAGEVSVSDRANMPAMAFQGSMRTLHAQSNVTLSDTRGSGHLGHSYVGCAMAREGRGTLVPPGMEMKK